MAKNIGNISFKSCVADPDIWLRPAVRSDKTEYYEYILMYVDDILEISTNATSILKSQEGDTVQYKNSKIAPHQMFLGSNLQKKVICSI